MVRSHPQWLAARKLVREGRIGDLRAMLGVFSYFNEDPRTFSQRAAFGGGALMDIGCYLINTSRFITGREPGASLAPWNAIQSSGRTVSPRCCWTSGDASGRNVQHADGALAADSDLRHARADRRSHSVQRPAGSRVRGRHRQRKGPVWRRPRAVDVPRVRPDTIQGDLFAKAVLEGTEVPEPLEDSIRNMECIEAVFRSAESGRWERPGQGGGPD